jgi:Protein of unknown function (DUF574).
MLDRPSWAPAEVDLTRPSVARVYDFYLGGSHNFNSDRRFAHEVLAVLPDMPALARENRHFLRRAVLHLLAAGVDQFLDLGSGIPTVGNVHEVAQGADPSGSHIVISHASTDGQSGAADLQDVYNRSRSPHPMRMRSRVEVEALFGDLPLVAPGVVRIPQWRPDSDDEYPDGETYPGFAGVARSD